jgi:CheY-like chemotaxis protein
LQGVFRDITDEQALNERLIQVEKLRALGEMASGVAHTFSNLLAVIGTTVQVIRRADPDADISGELKAIEQAVNDGGAAVRRIQDFTRQRREDLHKPVDLNALSSEVARLALNRHRATADKAAPAIDIKLELGNVPQVSGVGSQLRDVLMNIVFNAMDAMKDGGTLSLRSYRHQGRVVLAIQDTGPGMPDEVRSRVFQPFFSTKEERGSGLGLSIALNIVSQHGGSMEVDSEPGSGTTVRLLLPELCETPHEQHEQEPPRNRTAARVLLVEDEPVLLTQLSRLLEDEGHSVEAVATGEEARERLGAGRYDIVFTDVGMGAVSGWDVASLAREHGARVVFITGWGGEVSEQTAAEKGVDAVLRKPFPPDRVFRIIASLMSG